jgi:hypothetical protein
MRSGLCSLEKPHQFRWGVHLLLETEIHWVCSECQVGTQVQDICSCTSVCTHLIAFRMALADRIAIAGSAGSRLASRRIADIAHNRGIAPEIARDRSGSRGRLPAVFEPCARFAPASAALSQPRGGPRQPFGGSDAPVAPRKALLVAPRRSLRHARRD